MNLKSNILKTILLVIFILLVSNIGSAWQYTIPPTSILDSLGFRFGNTSLNSTGIISDFIIVQNITVKNIGGTIYANQYLTLHDAINASTGGVIFLSPGTYPISIFQTITQDNLTIRGSGIDSTVLSFGSDADAQLFFNGVNNTRISDLSITSANGIATDRIVFNNSNGIKLYNIKVTGGTKYYANFAIHFNANNENIMLDSVESTGGEDTPIRFAYTNQYVIIKNIYCHDSYGDCIDVYGIRDAVISDIVGTNLSQGLGIYADAQNLSIFNLQFSNIGKLSSGNAVAVSVWDNKAPHDITISNVQISDTGGHGFQFNSDQLNTIYNVVLSNIIVKDTVWAGIIFENTGRYSNIIISSYIAQNTGYGSGNSPIGLNVGTTNYTNVSVYNGLFISPFNIPNIPTNGSVRYNHIIGMNES